MINSRKLRSLYESKGKTASGALEFVNEMHHLLGLCDENGNKYRDHAGNPVVKNAKVTPEQFNLHEAAQAILGENWAEIVEGRTVNSFAALQKRAELEKAGIVSKELFEAVGVGVDPTAGISINSFSGFTSGLIERKILDAFQNPVFIADQLMPAEAMKASGQKFIQSSPLGDRAARRNAGEPHARANTYGRFVRLPDSWENALAIDITAEAIFYSLDNSLMQVAASVGQELAYRKEIECLETMLKTSSTFKWNDTAYNTYGNITINVGGYNNNNSSNALLDWTSIQNDVISFSRFTDPDTGKRLLIQPDTLLVPPALLETAKLILGSTGGQRRTGDGTQSTSTTLQVSETEYFPYAGSFKIVSSPLVEQVLVDTGTAANNAAASKYWFLIDTKHAFKFIQNMPLTVTQSTGSYEQLDKKVAISYFASYRGAPACVSPFHTFRNYA